jgi:glutathione S-transferase
MAVDAIRGEGGHGMMKVYGLKVSYFTGKFESYLRYKEIPYEYRRSTAEYFRTILREKTGAMQIPAVELDDGRWMTDTSPMIDWFEAQYPDHPILPADPVQAYLCRLIEDYADEWMWRPAMHYRWSYPGSAILLARKIVEEAGEGIPAPEFLKRWRIRRRQYTNFVKNDGINEQTRAQAEHSYTCLLEILNRIFDRRSYLFGDRPTLADIGLMGPLFRHCSMDPDPAVIMREEAPAVMEWVYRLWNARGSKVEGQLVSGVPDDLLPLIKEIGETHLENLCANALAWGGGESHFDVTIQGAPYTHVPTSQYRVWCLEELQRRYRELPDPAQGEVKSILEGQGAFGPLMRIAEPKSGYNEDGAAPFGGHAISVYSNVKG